MVLIAAAIAAAAFSVVAQEDSDDRSGEAIALFNQAQDAHEKGELDKAIAGYQKALTIIPQFPEAELQLANAYLSQGKKDDAEKALRRAVALREDWSPALASLGALLVDVRHYDEAEKLLEKAIELNNLNFPAYSALTELRIRTKVGPDVLGPLLATIKDLTGKARIPASIWAARAALENALGDRAGSRASIAKALEGDPKNVFALTESVNIALTVNDPQAAESYLVRLERAAPASSNLTIMKARILAAKGNAKEALALLDGAKTTGPEAEALRDAIRASTSTDPVALEKLLENDPKNGAVLGRLCGALRVSDAARALDYCRRAAEAEPQNIDHATGYGAALLQARRFEDAVSLLQKLERFAPDNSTIRANLATGLFQLKRYEEAKAEYRWLADHQPGIAAAFYFLAICHDQLEEYMDAMANYQQFLRIADPGVSKLEIEKVQLRLPALQKQIRDGKGKKHA
ncbi:MAG: tetratricopeptide repeat protein [Acidobacteriota bacterium]